MEKKYKCPMCDDFETDSKEYRDYHWSSGDCLGCPCGECAEEGWKDEAN